MIRELSVKISHAVNIIGIATWLHVGAGAMASGVLLLHIAKRRRRILCAG